MTRRWRTATGALVVLWALASAVLVAGSVAGDDAMAAEALPALIACVPAALLGILVFARRPDAPGATALASLAAGSATAEAITVWGLSADSPSPWPAAALGAYLGAGIWLLHFAGFITLCLVFPDGLLPGRVWRATAVTAVVVGVSVVLGQGRLSADDSAWSVAVQLVQVVVLLGVLCVAVAGLVARYRRGDDTTRNQLRWLALGAGTVVVLWVAGEVAQTLLGAPTDVYVPCLIALLVWLPVTVAIAVVRHDLFDIERLLSDSVSWVLTTAAAAGFFALIVALVLRALDGIGTTVTYVLAAFVTAAVVGPLHGVLRSWVGRALDRDRTVRVEKVRAFVRDVRDGTRRPEDFEPLLRELVQDDAACVVLDVPGRGAVGLDGVPAAARDGVDLLSGGTRVATVVLSRPSLRRQRLTRLLLVEAALPMELARSQVQLREALSAVEDSRARILVAGAEERRRLERDLHDGAQQRIVAVGMRLRSAQRRVDDPTTVSHELDIAVRELEDTVHELRRLARGLRPVGLDDGLGAAVRQLVHRSPVPTTVEVDDVELPEAVLTTAYFIVAEGVANALKHAAASHVGVRAVQRDDGRLLVEVEDDGRGGAVGVADLTTLRDRVDAVGGSLDLRERQPSGTVLRAVL